MELRLLQRISASSALRGHWYPKKIIAGDMGGDFATDAIEVLHQTHGNKPRDALRLAEFGIWRGATSLQLATFLGNAGWLDIFDFEDTVQVVARRLNERGFTNVTAYGSSYRHLDSYNWSLKRLLEKHTAPIWDFIYLDGAHTWAVDALTFFLCDLLLKPGGVIAFDDYEWRLRGSSLDPEKIPVIGTQYTDEQIDAMQVKAIVDLLVRRNPRYTEIKENFAFVKKA